MNKQNKISLILGVLVLTVLIISSSFAFFQITNTGSTETNTTLTGTLEDVESYGTASLSGPNNNLHIKIKASDMAPSKAGTHYYATINPDSDYELDKQNHLISTASIKNGEGNDDVVYECTSDLLIEASGSLVTDNVINAADGNIYFGGSGSTIEPTEISLKDIIDAQVDGGYKKQVKYKITGNGEATLTTDIDIINRNDDQNDIAGKQIDLTITNKNLVCTVKGIEENKAYMKELYVYYDVMGDGSYLAPVSIFNGSFPHPTNLSFVNYIPEDLEDSKIVQYMDLSDTEMGTPEGSVIMWAEDSGQQDEYEEPLYNVYIGSESKIYAIDLSESFGNVSNEINFDNLNTSETIYMSGMFERFSGNLDLSELDTSNVEDMSYMFRYSNATITFPQGFGSSATNMSGMFDGYDGTSLDLSNFDTSSVTDMRYMFQYISVDLPFQDWSNFVTSNVEDMYGMFAYYQGATLDLSTFDTSSVTDMGGMFSGCDNLEELKLGSWNLSSLEENTLTFGYLSANITFPKGFGSAATNMSYMFYEYEGNTLDLSNLDTSHVTDMSYMFSHTSANITFPQEFGTSATDMSYMFWEYRGASLDLSTFDTSSVTNMSEMFNDCINLTSLDLSSFNTINVTDMSWMFSGCYDLATLDLSSFTFDKITGNGEWRDGNYATFSGIPESCEVKIKRSQQELFESKFKEYYFTPTYVD